MSGSHSGVHEPDQVAALLAEAAWWRLAGLLLERPRPGWSDEVECLRREAQDPWLRRVAGGAPGAAEGSYLALLGPGGAVSPREVAYRGVLDPGRGLAELTGLFRTFAFHPQVEDPPDHIAVESGFAGYLALKEAHARAFGQRAEAEATQRARAMLLRDHLAPFAQRLTAALDAAGAGGVHADAARTIARRTRPHLPPGAPRPLPTACGGPDVGPGEDQDDLLCDGCGGRPGRGTRPGL